MTKQRTALVVEDNALVAMDARDFLALHGFDPVHVVSSIEFAEVAVREVGAAFALLVAHLQDETTAPLAAELARRGVPFGFVSDFSKGDDLPPAFRGWAFVTKPYTHRDLTGLLVRLGLIEAAAGPAPVR